MRRTTGWQNRFQMPRRGRLPWVSLLFLCCALAPEGTGAQQSSRVELLKHPYPYQAALTILSDLHRTTIEEFEAVHRLVNTDDVLTSASREWRTLGFDRWAPGEGRTSVRGFAFPFADAFIFYDKVFGWFGDYDDATGMLRPVLPGILQEKYQDWYARGFIGPIHTFWHGRDHTNESHGRGRLPLGGRAGR